MYMQHKGLTSGIDDSMRCTCSLNLVMKQPDLVKGQDLDSLDWLYFPMDKNSICNFVMKPVLTNKNVDDVCNVVREPGSKNAYRMPNRR